MNHLEMTIIELNQFAIQSSCQMLWENFGTKSVDDSTAGLNCKVKTMSHLERVISYIYCLMLISDSKK